MAQSLLSDDVGMIHQLPVLVVDDEEEVLKAIRRTVEYEGWPVKTASSPEEALKLIEDNEFSVVVSDYRMPKIDGVEFLVRVREKWPETERILLTAYADEGALERGINDAGISRFMRKPWKREVLVSVLRQAINHCRIRKEHAILLERVRNRNEELVYLNQRLQNQVEASDKAIMSFRRRWDVALNAILDAIIIISADMHIEGANDAAATIANQTAEELEGQLCHEALFQNIEPCKECPLTSGASRLTMHRNNRNYFMDARAYKLPGVPISHLCTYRDITREVAFENEAAQMEKLAAVGRLAGGIAHEINNPLHGILSFVQLAQKPGVVAEKLSRYHEIIYECAIRCRDTVQSLKSFARQPQPAEQYIIDPVEVTKKALILFHGNNITIDTEYISTAVRCRANANQLQQVLVNLVQNAIDASPKDGKVKVVVTVDGGDVLLSVTDQGKGITDDLRERIFEPFFTTKPEGVGTGLGLAISHGIMSDHHGSIKVENTEEGGACFEVRLPLAQDVATT
ncbi:MAG: response regulator [Deltaproteobacteria bacterium]|nr:response regulator [Deltaproteobacteria bacterium]